MSDEVESSSGYRLLGYGQSRVQNQHGFIFRFLERYYQTGKGETEVLQPKRRNTPFKKRNLPGQSDTRVN